MKTRKLAFAIAFLCTLGLVSGCTALTNGESLVPPKLTEENAPTYLLAANTAFGVCLAEYQKAIKTVNGTEVKVIVEETPASGVAAN